MIQFCTCGRRVYFDERIGYLHVQPLTDADWHLVDLAPSAARALHPSGEAA